MSKVSVVIPTYNCAGFICCAIKSVLAQTWEDYEIIVVDDGSADDTRIRLASYVVKGIIKYVYQENKGLPGARNAGAAISKGEYIFFLDADDEIVPDTLRDMVAAGKETGAGFVISDLMRVEDGHRQVEAALLPPLGHFYGLLRREFNFQARFYRKDVLSGIGLYDQDQKYYEDWDLYIRLFEKKIPYTYVPRVLYVYKIRQGSITKGKDIVRRLRYIERIYRKHYKRLADAGDKIAANIYAEVMWRLAADYLYKGKVIFRSCVCFLESCKYDSIVVRKYIKKVISI